MYAYLEHCVQHEHEHQLELGKLGNPKLDIRQGFKLRTAHIINTQTKCSVVRYFWRDSWLSCQKRTQVETELGCLGGWGGGINLKRHFDGTKQKMVLWDVQDKFFDISRHFATFPTALT